jgi:MFS family permease
VQSVPTVIFRRWIEWTCLALAYAIAFLQRLAPQVITGPVIADMGLDLTQAALLSSTYFLGYAVMQLPAGPMVDRFGVRRMALLSIGASVVGSIGFSMSSSLGMSCVFRLMIASGDALVFTALIKLVAQRFPDNQFSLMAGLSQFAGFVGGVVATFPLTLAVSHFGWRGTFGGIAAISGAIFVAGFTALAQPMTRGGDLNLSGILKEAGRALGRSPEWGCILAFTSQFVVLTTISGVWGIPLISYIFHVEPILASKVLLAHMIGNAVGSVVLGRVADNVAPLERALVLLSIARSMSILALLPIIARAFGVWIIAADLFLLGVISGAIIPIVLKFTKRVFTASRIGTGISLSATTAGIAAAIVQQAIAVAMGSTTSQTGAVSPSTTALSDANCTILIVIVLLISLAGGIAGPTLLLRRRDDPRELIETELHR